MTDFHRPPERPRLPDLSLPRADGGDAVPVRAHRRGTVLVLLGARVREADVEYLRSLAAHEDALRAWDGRVLVVVPDAASSRDGGAPGASPFPVVVDAASRLARAADVVPPALVVADQWGEVHVAEHVADGAAWLPPDEVEAWLRTIAERCAG